MPRRKPLFSRRIGKFSWDRRVFALLLALATLLAGRAWLEEHPQHNPWAPLDLRDPTGWATAMKLRAVKGDVVACRSVLTRSEVRFTALPPAGDKECARPDRTRLDRYPLAPSPPPTTCAVAIALELWQRDTLDPEAQAIFGSGVARVEHLGAYSCRRMYGRDQGPWSEHATGNAIDIAAVVLKDGTRLSVLKGLGWRRMNKARFLHRIRDGACRAFSTVLSPDYNAAHRNHLASRHERTVEQERAGRRAGIDLRAGRARIDRQGETAMIVRTVMLAVLVATGAPVVAQNPALPPAIYMDPPTDAQHPARMEVLHVPSGGVEINGVAYIAAGAGHIRRW